MSDARARVRRLHRYEGGVGLGFVKKIGRGMPRM